MENRRVMLYPYDPFAYEDDLEYFNVYFPYADDNLRLTLTDNPEDRPIAAEFLIRRARFEPNFVERLFPMSPPGDIRISRDKIWVGTPLDRYEFRYIYIRPSKDGSRVPRLILESKFTRLMFRKISNDAGDIRDSYVSRLFAPEKFLELKQRYEELRKQAFGSKNSYTVPHKR